MEEESNWTVAPSKKEKRIQKILAKISILDEEKEEPKEPLPSHFLPTDVLILIVSECGDMKSYAALRRVCKLYHKALDAENTNVQVMWRNLYFKEWFEDESNPKVIHTSGTWKQRFILRRLLRKAKGILGVFSLSDKRSYSRIGELYRDVDSISVYCKFIVTRKVPIFLEWNKDSKISSENVLIANLELTSNNSIKIDYKLPLRIRSYDISNDSETTAEISFSEEEWLQRFSRPDVLPVVRQIKDEIQLKYNRTVEYIDKRGIFNALFHELRYKTEEKDLIELVGKSENSEDLKLLLSIVYNFGGLAKKYQSNWTIIKWAFEKPQGILENWTPYMTSQQKEAVQRLEEKWKNGVYAESDWLVKQLAETCIAFAHFILVNINFVLDKKHIQEISQGLQQKLKNIECLIQLCEMTIPPNSSFK